MSSALTRSHVNLQALLMASKMVYNDADASSTAVMMRPACNLLQSWSSKASAVSCLRAALGYVWTGPWSAGIFS